MNPFHVSRRKFLEYLSMVAAASPLQGRAIAKERAVAEPFNFMFLGDLHFDKLMHHDMNYLKEKYPNDIHQIENYSRIPLVNLSSLLSVSEKCTNKTDA